jgi:hypothetical protein
MIQNQKMARWVCSKPFLFNEFDPELDSGFFFSFRKHIKDPGSTINN